MSNDKQRMTLEDVKEMTRKAGRYDELEQENKKLENRVKELEKENKRYKKLISGFLDSGYASDWVKEPFIRVLEGECIHCNGKGFNGLDYCTQCN